MPAKVALKITEGKLKGKDFSFNERTSCIFGRSDDCKVTETQLPEDDPFVSRHHCMLDINPPEATIRDFGSLNGTYLNDVKIGQRARGSAPEDAQKEKFPEHDIKNGDRIKIGDSVFSVTIHNPCHCARCQKEIPEELSAKAERKPGLFQCDECFRKTEKSPGMIPMKKRMTCKMCGKDVTPEIGYTRVGDYVCKSCLNEPMKFIEMLLDLAKSGNRDLIAIDGYRVLRILGQGGMGIVYLAEKKKTGEKIALKVMIPKIATDDKAKSDFLRETENTKALRHKNIVQLYDNGYSNATFFMTLDYCNGGSVDKLMLDKGGALSVDEASRIILDVLDGLEYAHYAEIPHVKLSNGEYGKGRGLIHRDISPHNIFLMNSNGSSCAKLGDFGLAKAFDLAGLSGRTRTGTAAGKPFYMPRQQVLNYKFSKPEVDVWAVAASFYKMLTNDFPRNFPKDQDVWQTVLQNRPIPIRDRNKSIPKKLAEVIDEALIDNPEIKIKTAAELKKRIQAAM